MRNVKLRDVTEGDVFYESEYGEDIEWHALESARRVDDEHEGWRRRGFACRCRSRGGRELDLFESENPGAHGLKLYSQPEYGNIVD